MEKKPGRDSVPLSGPKKQWVDKALADEAVLPTQLDADSQEMDVDAKTGTKRSTEDTEAAAAAKRRGNSETAGAASASSSATPTSKLVGSDVEETEELKLLLNEALGWKCDSLAAGQSAGRSCFGQGSRYFTFARCRPREQTQGIFRELGAGSGRERDHDCSCQKHYSGSFCSTPVLLRPFQITYAEFNASRQHVASFENPGCFRFPKP